MTDYVMPEQGAPIPEDDEKLLSEYVRAEFWVGGAMTTKQAKAWETAAARLRREVLKRMKASS